MLHDKSGIPDTPHTGVQEDLDSDPRWELTQRVVASEGFQRAAQLRQILLYISRSTIHHPDEPVREHEIAQNALGRRANFDPSSDNIVRVQISHLRRRLAQYFESEGRKEELRIVLPRGTYAPQFVKFHAAPELIEAKEPEALSLSNLRAPVLPVAPVILPTSRGSLYAAAGFALLFLIFGSLSIYLWARNQAITGALTGSSIAKNPFLGPLVTNRADTSIILSDTSYTVIEEHLKQDATIADYLKTFPSDQLTRLTDPGEKNALTLLATKRATAFGEATVAANLLERLRNGGAVVSLRYARDLHVQAFGEGNAIILGSRRSNPWAMLFAPANNYQYMSDSERRVFYFKNTNPAPGQDTAYYPGTFNQPDVVSYVDISIHPNLNGNGLVLVVDGSDVQATESAANYMLDGQFPESLRGNSDMKRPSLEVFLRGHHAPGEANFSFEVLDVRKK